MRILLFRHAPAEAGDPDRWPDDLARPLTARGRTRARRMARALIRLEPGLSRVLSSPARRALETARILGDALGSAFGVDTLDCLAPGGSTRDTLRALAHEPAEAVVAVVGHEPDLGRLAGTLLFGATGEVPLRKAGACAIEAAAPEAGAGRLRWFLSPGTLRALARKRNRT